MITKAMNVYNSSLVRESVYEYETKRLTIEFASSMYEYFDVSVEDYNLFVNADSQGKALNEIIKGKYEFKKIETVDGTN
jgi:hypothetical protein